MRSPRSTPSAAFSKKASASSRVSDSMKLAPGYPVEQYGGQRKRVLTSLRCGQFPDFDHFNTNARIAHKTAKPTR